MQGGNILTQLSETLPITRHQATDLINQFLRAIKMEAMTMKSLDIEEIAERFNLYPHQAAEAIEILLTPLREAILGNSEDCGESDTDETRIITEK
jgi:nucleoid DNA-binding protein